MLDGLPFGCHCRSKPSLSVLALKLVLNQYEWQSPAASLSTSYPCPRVFIFDKEHPMLSANHSARAHVASGSTACHERLGTRQARARPQTCFMQLPGLLHRCVTVQRMVYICDQNQIELTSLLSSIERRGYTVRDVHLSLRSPAVRRESGFASQGF